MNSFVSGCILAVMLLCCRSEAAWGAAVAKAEETAVTAEVSGNQGLDTDHSHGADHGHGGDHGHGHDPIHSNLSDDAEDPAEFRSDMAIASLIVFSCLLLGLTAVAWKPISEGLQKREKSIANNMQNAERASREAMAKLKQYEAPLASAPVEAQKIIADARKDAEAVGQRLIQTAQEEAAIQRTRAVADIESAKAVALNELAEKSTDLAMSLASRVVGREVNAGDHQSMIQEMLSKLPSRN